jgi:hypothetical protein
LATSIDDLKRKHTKDRIYIDLSMMAAFKELSLK